MLSRPGGYREAAAGRPRCRRQCGEERWMHPTAFGMSERPWGYREAAARKRSRPGEGQGPPHRAAMAGCESGAFGGSCARGYARRGPQDRDSLGLEQEQSYISRCRAEAARNQPGRCQGEHPDLTIFLEIPAKESILRRKNLVPDRIESEGINFLQKVNEGFKLIAKEKNWKVISAMQNINTISNEIKETLLKHFS